MSTDQETYEGSPPSGGSDSSREMPWARCQNMVALVCFAAVVIAAPGGWKWASVAIACVYLTTSDGD